MELLVFVLGVLLAGLVIGALARLAVPGPDPMSIWKTIALGVAGAVVGGLFAALLDFRADFVLSVVGAVLVLIAYRRWVQRRPLTGPGAHRLPESADPIDRLRELRSLRDRGQISAEEFERRKAELAAKI